MRGQKGITLVALIITIVVLLILAVVTITTVTQFGILDKAETAGNTYNDAVDKESTLLTQIEDNLAALITKYGK